MKGISAAMGISRSHQYARRFEGSQGRSRQYHKPDDERYLALIRRVIGERPESNGMAEAFVKIFKRDYIHTHSLDDPRTVLEQLPNWFNDYNERHPHKALKMMSPRQFRRRAIELEVCPVN